MGIYLNLGNDLFQEALNSEIYIDKSMLISYTNKKIRTKDKNLCVSRPRRFGKSMAADMLVAYYSRGCNSKEQFENLKIAKNPDFEKHLNRYHVIHVNIQNYLSESQNMEEMLRFMEDDILFEIENEFADLKMPRRKTLSAVLETAYAQFKIPFIFIIDEWDSIFRIHKNDAESQKKYLDFLRNILKDRSYVALAYMTGILPIKKYGEHSALNMFIEYSMTDATPIEEFTGFTEQEVKQLCEKYNMSFAETKKWYDGYCVDGVSIYNPKSVVEAMVRRKFSNYWTQTETYEALKTYIHSNEFGVQDAILKLMAGETVKIDTTTFTNDMVTFATRDDVLTLLVHLGYLTYNSGTKEISIPNYEISEQFISTIKVLGWNEVVNSLKISDELLQATLKCNAEKVAKLIEQAHQENTSILKYNDENSLSCVVSLAYYSARKYYTIHRELPAGKGFADIVFEPNRNCNMPAMIVELKWGHSADEAIAQIKNKNYTDFLKNYHGEILLVGVNYDKEKHHTCRIERVKI